MKTKIKGIIIFLALIMAVSAGVNAAGTTVIDISSKDIKVGDSFKVNIRATEAGEMEILYDSRVIKAVGTSANQISSTSHSVTVNGQNVTVNFEAKAEGTSGVIVKSPSLTGSSISVKVAPVSSSTAGTAQVTGTEGEQHNADTSDTVKEPIAEIPSPQLPQEDYIGNENGYVIPMEKAPFSESLVKSEFKFNDKTFSGYQFAGAESSFYYFYGINEGNIEGWYFYDHITGKLGPADVNTLSLIGDNVKTGNKGEGKKLFGLDFTPNIFIYAAIFFVVIMIIVFIINIILKKREENMDFAYDDDEDIDLVFEHIEKSEKKENKSNKNLHSVEEAKSEGKNADSIYNGIKGDELIDELIKKASKDKDIKIINLDDL